MRALSNMLGASKERYAIAVGLDPALSTAEMIAQTRKIMGRRIAPVQCCQRQEAPVNEIVLRGNDIDLTKLPAPVFWPGDGGRYIGTGDITFTRDPDTGRINVGVYRQMAAGAEHRVGHVLLARQARAARPRGVVGARQAVRGGRSLWHRPGAVHGRRAGLRGRSESELDAAGGLMGRPVELTKAEFVSLPIPANAEFVIEGHGARGRRTRRKGRSANSPAITAMCASRSPSSRSRRCTCRRIADHHRRPDGQLSRPARSAPITPSCARRGFWTTSNASACPGVRGAYAHPAAASGWGMAIVSLTGSNMPGHAAQVLALAAQCPAAAYYTKWVIAVDEDVDPTDFNDVLWALSTRCNPSDDLDVLRNTWSTGLDPSQYPPEERPYGSKVLINACKPHRYMKEFPQAHAAAAGYLASWQGALDRLRALMLARRRASTGSTRTSEGE